MDRGTQAEARVEALRRALRDAQAACAAMAAGVERVEARASALDATAVPLSRALGVLARAATNVEATLDVVRVLDAANAMAAREEAQLAAPPAPDTLGAYIAAAERLRDAAGDLRGRGPACGGLTLARIESAFFGALDALVRAHADWLRESAPAVEPSALLAAAEVPTVDDRLSAALLRIAAYATQTTQLWNADIVNTTASPFKSTPMETLLARYGETRDAAVMRGLGAPLASATVASDASAPTAAYVRGSHALIRALRLFFAAGSAEGALASRALPAPGPALDGTKRALRHAAATLRLAAEGAAGRVSSALAVCGRRGDGRYNDLFWALDVLEAAADLYHGCVSPQRACAARRSVSLSPGPIFGGSPWAAASVSSVGSKFGASTTASTTSGVTVKHSSVAGTQLDALSPTSPASGATFGSASAAGAKSIVYTTPAFTTSGIAGGSASATGAMSSLSNTPALSTSGIASGSASTTGAQSSTSTVPASTASGPSVHAGSTVGAVSSGSAVPTLPTDALSVHSVTETVGQLSVGSSKASATAAKQLPDGHVGVGAQSPVAPPLSSASTAGQPPAMALGAGGAPANSPSVQGAPGAQPSPESAPSVDGQSAGVTSHPSPTTSAQPAASAALTAADSQTASDRLALSGTASKKTFARESGSPSDAIASNNSSQTSFHSAASAHPGDAGAHSPGSLSDASFHSADSAARHGGAYALAVRGLVQELSAPSVAALTQAGVAVVRGILDEVGGRSGESLPDADVPRPLPSATVSEATSEMVVCLRVLLDYTRVLEGVLAFMQDGGPDGMIGPLSSSADSAGPAVDDTGRAIEAPAGTETQGPSQLLFASSLFFADVLRGVDRVVRSQVSLFRRAPPAALFELNNANHVLRALRASPGIAALLPAGSSGRHYEERVAALTLRYVAHWEKVSALLAPDSTRAAGMAPRDRLRAWTGEFEDLHAEQARLAVPDAELKDALVSRIRAAVIPRFEAFYNANQPLFQAGALQSRNRYDPSYLNRQLSSAVLFTA